MKYLSTILKFTLLGLLGSIFSVLTIMFVVWDMTNFPDCFTFIRMCTVLGFIAGNIKYILTNNKTCQK